MQSQNLNKPPQAIGHQPQSHWKTFQPPPYPSGIKQRSWREGFSQGFSNLSIRYKICCGYGLALGVAVGGTAIGLMAGNYYYQRASHQVDIDSESRQLRDLQTVLMKTEIDRSRLVNALEQPKAFQKKYDDLQKHIKSIKQLQFHLKNEVQTTNIPGIQEFLQKYNRILETYIKELDLVLTQITTIKGSKNRSQVGNRLLTTFEQADLRLQLDSLMNDLAQVLEEADVQEDLARESAVSAEVVRSRIIITSIILSIIIAALLANYISWVITHSLKTVTLIAQQVTEEADFDLQVPIENQDEVGILATSLNQMIENTKDLLVKLQIQQESQLIQSEKMASLGRMLSGVAHELKNPINFIYGNVEPAKEYVDDLLGLIAAYEAEILNPPPVVLAKYEEVDLNFIKEDLPKILTSMEVGAERAMTLIASLKDFSRLDQAAPHLVDLHTCLESSLLLLHHRIKKGITVVRHYGDIPKIEGYMGLLYQVFMNILSHEIDGLESILKQEKEPLTESELAIRDWDSPLFIPTITITTECLDPESVVVRIADNGPGMSLSSQEKMFQTFFAAKCRSSGTSLGLAISKNIIVEKHGGTINCWSELGMGTEFIIALPMEQILPKEAIDQEESAVS